MNARLDQATVGLSLVCILHCLAPLVLVLPFFGLSSLHIDQQTDYWFHLIMLCIGIPLSGWALFGVASARKLPLTWFCLSLIALGFILLGGSFFVTEEESHRSFTLLGATLIAAGHLSRLLLYRKHLLCDQEHR